MNTKTYSKKPYETDPSKIQGKALEILAPKTIEETKNLIAKTKRIVPRGGGSGIYGGTIPLAGEDSVLDLSTLNRIGEIDRSRNLIEVEAGVILKDLQLHLQEAGYEFPLDMLSEGICTIGGMIATNATGARSIKYGRMSNLIRWIDVIDSEGRLVRRGTTELSDYAGMEGTTGVIVKACIKIIPKIPIRTASLIKLNSLQEIEQVVIQIKRIPEVSMIELFDQTLAEKLGLEQSPYLLVEYEGEKGKAKDEPYKKLLSLRKNIYGTLANEGHTRIEDVKIQLHSSEKIFEWLKQKHIPFFAHIGVGILHPFFKPEQEELIPEFLKLVSRNGGSIHGTLGIGLIKKEFLEYLDKKIYENIKKRTDPKNKFNQGKMI